MVSEHMKRFSTTYLIREQQIKTTARYHYTSIRKSGILTSPNADKDLDQQKQIQYILIGNLAYHTIMINKKYY